MPIKHTGREWSRNEQMIQNSEVRLRSKTNLRITGKQMAFRSIPSMISPRD